MCTQVEALSDWIKRPAADAWSKRNTMLIIKMLISDTPSSFQRMAETTFLALLNRKWIPTQPQGECISILDVCIGGMTHTYWGAPRQRDSLCTAVQVTLWRFIDPERCAIERLAAVFESVPIAPVQHVIRQKVSRCADWEWEPTYNIGIDPGMRMSTPHGL